MNKLTIVFKLEYLRKTGWGAISNFITKFSEKIPVELSDVETVSSIVLEVGNLNDNYALIKKIDSGRDFFKNIKKPEKIYITSEKYEYVFFISIDFSQLFDVVDLQSLYLIFDSCKKYKLVALISGEQKEYHKTSHFFSFLTEDKKGIYQNVFFKSDIIKHLQIFGIGTLSKFLPLVPVNAWEDLHMRQKVREYVSADFIREILTGKKADKNVPQIIAGALKKLSFCHKKIKDFDVEKCAVYLSDLSILSFLLFCFSLEGKENPYTDLREFAEGLQAATIWADGCVQLLENIVFHSQNKKGAFSFRVLDGDAAYITEKYCLTDARKKWIEMMIVDYAGCTRTYNIAEQF